MQLHDAHAHLEMLLEKLEIIKELDREDQGIYELNNTKLDELLSKHEFIIQATVSTKNYLEVRKLFSDSNKIYFLLGSHPEIIDTNFDVENYLTEQNQLLKQNPNFFKDERLVGIGEIGLDYYYSQDPEIWNKQKQIFRSQIELSIKQNLPIQIHTRNAFEDTYKILLEYPELDGKLVVHCFSEGVPELKKILDIGGFIGIGGISTYPKATSVIEAAKYCPSHKFVLETDLPYLAPTPTRGKICLPEYIDYTAQNLANLRGTTKENILQQSKENILKIFDKIKI